MKLKSSVTTVVLLICTCVAQPQAKFPPETKNAALRYWMAFAEMQDPPADKATQDLLERTAEGQAQWDEKKLGPILDANEESIRMMQRAAKLPECDWGLEYDRGPRAAIAYAPRARVLSRLNTLQGMREMRNGDSQAAVDTWLAGIRFSEHLANGGSLIFALIAKSALLPNLQALAAAAARRQISELQKKQVLLTLKGMPEAGFDWSAAWGFEELTGETFLEEMKTSTNPASTYESLMDSPIPSGASAPNSKDIEKYRAYMKAAQTALSLPPETAKARLSELEPDMLALTPVAQQIIPSAQKENDARLEILKVRKELLETIAAK